MSVILGTFSLKRLLFLSVCVCISFISSAQLCSGSLGDPAVNITFGSAAGNNIGFTPSADYTYTNSSCPNDGFYTITGSTTGCFGNAWHTVNSDHTGSGAFMLVNASFQPGDFFVATVTGLCPATTYEFAAWIMNVLISPSGIKPDITFSIETPSGAILNQFNTGDINATPQPVWKQYGFFFTTTAGNPDIVLRMRNNAPGGIGNDLGLDDITFRPCGPTLNSAIQGNADTVNVCVYEQTDYSFTGTVSPGFLFPVFQWQVSTDSGKLWTDISGANTVTYQRRPSGTAANYWYRLTVVENGNAGLPSCRIASNILTINVQPRPAISAGPDRVAISGRTTTLAATIQGSNISFAWTPPDYLSSTTELNPVVSPDRDMQYKLSAISQYGCANEDLVLVKFVAGIFVPTAFTPDKNGKNDSWRIPFLDPQWGATVNVYNRYGQLVYKVSGATTDWDGTYKGVPQPSGVYVYLIRFNDGTQDIKGTVTLIR